MSSSVSKLSIYLAVIAFNCRINLYHNYEKHELPIDLRKNIYSFQQHIFLFSVILTPHKHSSEITSATTALTKGLSWVGKTAKRCNGKRLFESGAVYVRITLRSFEDFINKNTKYSEMHLVRNIL